MVNIYQHTQYCEGRGYVNPRSLADAMAQEKANTRVTRDATELLTRGQLQQQQLQANRANPFAQPSPPTQAQAFIQPLANFAAQALFAGRNGLQAVNQLPQQFGQNATQLAQNLQQNPNFLARAVGQVLGFFFSGSKRARNERDDEADELREQNDTAVQDTLSFTEIKEPDASAMSKGS